MAPTLWGPRLIAACTACERQHCIAADTYDASLLTRCPTCGGVCHTLPGTQPGTIVTLANGGITAPLEPRLDDRAAVHSQGRRFHRLDCVAFRQPQTAVGLSNIELQDATSPWVVKRLWGMPGERLAFRDGELWVDGELFQKSLEGLAQVAVPVARYGVTRPTSDPSDKSPRSTDGNRDWTFPQSMQLQTTAPGEWIWEYRRPARVDPRHAASETWLAASPLLDDYPHNQNVSRRLHPVGDCLLKLTWQGELEKSVTIELTTHRHSVQVVIQSARKVASTMERRQSTAEPTPAEPTLASDRFESRVEVPATNWCTLAICDGRLLVQTAVVDVTQRLDQPANSGQDLSEQRSFKLRLQVPQDNVIESIELWRDLYLYETTEQVVEWQVPSERVFVLGDNLPISSDSRSDAEFAPHISQLFHVAE